METARGGLTWELVDGQDLKGRYSPGLFPVDRLQARVRPQTEDA